VGQISVLFLIFCNFFNFTKATKCLLKKTQLKLKYTYFFPILSQKICKIAKIHHPIFFIKKITRSDDADDFPIEFEGNGPPK
jgi:hypothetical protein